jgi:dTDP-4-amino-4,6-dideoxygalactose transaminase
MPEKLAIDGGTPVRSKSFASWPRFTKDIIEAGCNLLKTKKLKYVPDGQVSQLERSLAETTGSRHAVCVCNGTLSIQVALGALGVSHGDEVISSGLDHPANLNSVWTLGAIPVFADITPDHYNIDPQHAEELISPKTRAIIVTHMVGLADISAFEALSKKHDIPIVYDCARAIGSQWKGKRLGAFGTASSYSFEESKIINAGEGGAIATDDNLLAQKLYAYRNRGKDRNGVLTNLGVLGSNYRMTELQAVCIKPQLAKLDKLMVERQQRMDFLAGQLRKIDGVTLPVIDSRATKVAHYTVIIQYEAQSFGGLAIEDFIANLKAEGIPCLREWLPPFEYARQIGITLPINANCPVAEKVQGKAVVLSGHILHSSKKDLIDIPRAFEKIQRLAS